jgi:hypothetical protein
MFFTLNNFLSFIIGVGVAPVVYLTLMYLFYKITGYPKLYIEKNENHNTNTSNENENVNENENLDKGFINYYPHEESKTE